MREMRSTVTAKGQVTIPVEIRRLLRLKARDKVAFVLEGDQIRLARGEGVVARTAGILKGTQPPMTAEELREAAEQAIAEDVAERTDR